MADEPKREYSNIRQILGSLIGTKVLDITQHDPEEWDETGKSYIQLHFDNGEFVKFFIGDDGFDHSCLEIVDEKGES